MILLILVLFQIPFSGWVTSGTRYRVTSGLFRNFDATHGAGPGQAADEYGRTRALRSSNPARPYIWRLIIFSRLIWPSTCPVLHEVSTAADTAEMSFCSP